MERDVAATRTMVMQQLQAGRFAEVHELFAPALRELISVDVLRQSWEELLAAQGPIAVVVAIDDTGHLTGLQFSPEGSAEGVANWEPPSYADPAAFTEHDVTVGRGALSTPGTLSAPESPGPLPAVVLLAGSGPADRDATMGRNKILKDLAWGLASRGIAVLRFDKVTYTHRESLAGVTDLTVVDEYVRPAVAAVRLLCEHPSIDASRVFVLGHSEGGTLAPRVAAAEPSVAGLIVLAGATQPMHHAIVRQFRYLAGLRDPDADVDADPAVQTVTRQCALIDSPDFSPSTPAHLLPFGVPAPYWFDLRGYDPVATAARLDTPMLIVQGGRDYQVTVADDLAGWQRGLAQRPDVTIRIYDAADHLFFSGSGPSTPADYVPAQHVDEAVVTDIIQWVSARPVR